MNKKLFRELLIRSEGLHPTPREVSTELQARCDAILAQHAAPKVISESVMRIAILQFLTKGRADGGEIAEKLDEMKVRLSDEGEGPIFALLSIMERDRLISGAFNIEMTKKTYTITNDRGKALLEQQGDAARSLNSAIEPLWAT